MTKQQRVIVADDDRDSAEMLAVLVRNKLGLDVSAVYDGRAAVEASLAEHPVAVILDLDMPVLGGADAAKAIRNSGLHPLPILVAVSGRVELARSQDEVFDHALSKPVDLPRLLDLLASVALRRAQA